MKEKIKKRIKIKVTKIYKENISQDEKGNSSEPKEEDFDWIKENNLDIKKKYLNFPLEKWRGLVKKNLGDRNKDYQSIVNIILKKDIFKNENKKEKFFAEVDEKNNNLITLFYDDINEYRKDNPNINPDFIVKNLEVKHFLDLIKNRKYMFRYDTDFIKLENYDYINIIGEIKINPDLINARCQKDRYIDFCQNMNNKYKDKRTYFLILYIIDQSYQKFWEKNFFNGRPIIISYIPQIFNDKCLINQKEISSEIENSIQEQKRKENIILKIKVEKIYLSGNENEKSSKNEEIIETNIQNNLSEDNMPKNEEEKSTNLFTSDNQRNFLGNYNKAQTNFEELEENYCKERKIELEKYEKMMNEKKKNLEKIKLNISNMNNNKIAKKRQIMKLKLELMEEDLNLDKEKIKKENEEDNLKDIFRKIDEIKIELNCFSIIKGLLTNFPIFPINESQNLLGKKRFDKKERDDKNE